MANANRGTRNRNKFDIGVFFKKLLGIEEMIPPAPQTLAPIAKEIEKKESNSFDKDFVIILPKIEMYTNTHVPMDQAVVKKITDLRKLSNDYSLKIHAEPECCVCLEEKENIHLKCLHTLCKKCYEDMITHSYTFSEVCPICNKQLELFKYIEPSYVMITHLTDFNIGLVPTPAVYDIPNSNFITSMVVKNLMTSTYAGSAFENFMNYLLYKQYMLIFLDDVSMEIMTSVMDLQKFKTESANRL